MIKRWLKFIQSSIRTSHQLCKPLSSSVLFYQYTTISFMNDRRDISDLRSHIEEPLISELLLYGVLNSETLTIEDISNSKLQVGVLQHYINGEILTKQGQNQFYQMWAYPDGIKIYDNRLKVINDDEPEQSFGNEHKISLYSTEIIQGHVTERPKDYIYSFVHTDYGLNRNYFTALCWHEKKYCALNKEKLNVIQNKNIYTQRLPKCTLWQLQNDPLMIDFNKQLIYVPKVILVASKYPIFVFQREILKFYYRNVLVETSDLLISQQKYTYFKDLIHLVGYPQAEKHFDYEETANMFPSRNIRHKQVRKDSLKQFYTSFFFLPKLSREVNQIEIMDCWNSSIKFSPMLFNKNVCFYKPNINILPIIKKIGLENLMQLWKCVILERKILIFSMNNLSVVELCETILYLIEPIRWENIYIPFLPFHLVNSIDAIQGYLIGMSRIHMDYIIIHYDMNDKVIFDLDENVIIQNGGKNLVELPDEIAAMISTRLGLLGIKKKEKLFSYLFKEYDEKVFQSEEEKIFRIKQILFDGMLFLLNNYRIFASLSDDLLQFDKEGYKSMFPDKKWAEFAGQLVNTMVFTRLCEYHLYEEKILRWNQYSMGGLFVYCQNILASKYKEEKLWLVPKLEKGPREKIVIPYHEYFNYVLTNDLEKLKELRKVYLIQHYLIKFLSYQDYTKDNAGNVELEAPPEANNLKKMIIHCLFPWISQIEEECKHQHNRIDNRNSLRLSVESLPKLQSLFGAMKRQGSTLNRRNIEKLLKQHKGNESKYLNYRLLKRNVSNDQRKSV